MHPVQKQTHFPLLGSWLQNTVQKSSDLRYYYRRLEENPEKRIDIISELKALVNRAHNDARRRWLNAFDISQSLDPLEEEMTTGFDMSLIAGFPAQLELKTLKGYFGEIFSAMIAENCSSLDEDWIVPVLPFRYHLSAYHMLEKLMQGGGTPPPIIGRHGSDMVAFQRDDNEEIIRSLICEAKCASGAFNQSTITKAHEQSSGQELIPMDIFQLAEALKEHEDTDPLAASWRQSIIRFRFKQRPDFERCDLVAYICGLPPANARTITIPEQTPHPAYTAGRRLEAVEIHLHDVDGLIREAYQVVTPPPANNLSSQELSELWEKILPYFPKARQEFLATHGTLIAFDNKVAVVGIDSLIAYRMFQSQKTNIQQAFTDYGFSDDENTDKPIKIQLEVK